MRSGGACCKSLSSEMQFSALTSMKDGGGFVFSPHSAQELANPCFLVSFLRFSPTQSVCRTSCSSAEVDKNIVTGFRFQGITTCAMLVALAGLTS